MNLFFDPKIATTYLLLSSALGWGKRDSLPKFFSVVSSQSGKETIKTYPCKPPTFRLKGVEPRRVPADRSRLHPAREGTTAPGALI